MTFFGFFFFCCTSSRRDETFLLLPKFHIFSRSEKSWGDKEYENFRLKWRRRPKNDFFSDFFFSCTSTHQGATFLFLSKFHIFSRSEKSWGDKEKRYIEQQQQRRTNDERRTNERRTTNYIDDDNSPPGFFQNPRANNRAGSIQLHPYHNHGIASLLHMHYNGLFLWF